MESEKTPLRHIAFTCIIAGLLAWMTLREISLARHTLIPPPMVSSTSLTYQFILCTEEEPCSPMKKYYVSSMCYGYLDTSSNTGSPGILSIHDMHPFSGGENSRAEYICNIGGASYETFFLYYF